jgi:hypothetical protein
VRERTGRCAYTCNPERSRQQNSFHFPFASPAASWLADGSSPAYMVLIADRSGDTGLSLV